MNYFTYITQNKFVSSVLSQKVSMHITILNQVSFFSYYFDRQRFWRQRDWSELGRGERVQIRKSCYLHVRFIWDLKLFIFEGTLPFFCRPPPNFNFDPCLIRPELKPDTLFLSGFGLCWVRKEEAVTIGWTSDSQSLESVSSADDYIDWISTSSSSTSINFKF